MDEKIITTELLEYYDTYIKEYINEKFNAISYNLKVYVDEHLAGKASNKAIDELKQTIDNLTIGTLSETDPTVPAWAKQSTKPSYTVDEIEGMDELKQQIENITVTENDPTVASWAKEETKPTYTADEIDGINTVIESYVEETILGGEW